MISTDEQALICDMAETYGILDYRSLPVRLAATLSAGLRDDSRIKTKMRGQEEVITRTLLEAIRDNLTALLWLFGAYGTMELEDVLSNNEEKKQETVKYQTYSSGSDFDAAWNQMGE